MSYQLGFPAFIIELTDQSYRGGIIAGWLSQHIGRRLTMMCVYVINYLPCILYRILYSLFALLTGGTYSHLWSVVRMFIFCKAFVPLWILPSSFSALAAGAFCIQFGVQGAIGVVRRLVSIRYSTPLTVVEDSHSLGGDVSTCIPSNIPWCRLSIGERKSRYLLFESTVIEYHLK